LNLLQNRITDKLAGSKGKDPVVLLAVMKDASETEK